VSGATMVGVLVAVGEVLWVGVFVGVGATAVAVAPTAASMVAWTSGVHAEARATVPAKSRTPKYFFTAGQHPVNVSRNRRRIRVGLKISSPERVAIQS